MHDIIYGQSFADYRKADGLNKSSIDKLLRCPAEYHELTLLPQPEPTPSMRFGTALHSYVLTPEQFLEDVCILSAPATTKAGKAQKQEAEAKGQTVISTDDYERLFRMAGHMRRHPRIRPLLPHVECEVTKGCTSLPGDSEVSLFWEEEFAGRSIQCKARVDRIAILPSGEVIGLDVKTTSGGLDPDSLAKTIATYHYHRQAAWYVHGMNKLGLAVSAFVFVFTSTQPPYLCVPVMVESRAEMLGLEECRLATDAYAEGLQTEEWPTYSDTIEEICLPEWAYYRSRAKLPEPY